MITLKAIYWPRTRGTSKVQQARDLRAAGATWGEIAREIGIPESTVRGWCNEHGTASGAPEPGPVPVARRTVRQ